MPRMHHGALSMTVLIGLVLAVACTPPAGPASCGNAPTGFSHRQTTVDGARMHYVVGGSGPAVVLLHGFPETWQAWRAVLPRLAAEHTVIAPDLAGTGCSSTSRAGYAKATLAAQVHELVADLGFRRAAVVGHDIGGMVAYAYTSRYRSEVDRMALSGAVIPGFGLERLIDPDRRDGWLPHLKSFMRPGAAARFIVGRERAFLTRFIGSPTVVRSPAFEDYLAAYSRAGRADAALGLYRALPKDTVDNRRNLDAPLTVPVLTIGGQAERDDPTVDSARLVAQDVRHVRLPGSGHYVPEEQPAAFGAAVLDFLR